MGLFQLNIFDDIHLVATFEFFAGGTLDKASDNESIGTLKNLNVLLNHDERGFISAVYGLYDSSLEYTLDIVNPAVRYDEVSNFFVEYTDREHAHEEAIKLNIAIDTLDKASDNESIAGYVIAFNKIADEDDETVDFMENDLDPNLTTLACSDFDNCLECPANNLDRINGDIDLCSEMNINDGPTY